MSYNNDGLSSMGGGGDVEVETDPSAGGLFTMDFKKHEDLKNMLDSNKDGLKLDAMKRIIGMIAKGKNASHLFPAVVKNVASKNIELKKLVYVYLERYAEEQQDLALLSISTFQRGLKDQNQLIRASALRVLSSIRVSIIVPIMMLAIKEAVNDMSPFVRKTAAHAIPKLYSLDPEQKENLIEVLEKLLNDRTTLVAGSVVMAFQELCPDRIDLMHKHYRKLCGLLVDVDEWGQITIIDMLTKYARTQFLDPNKGEADMEIANRPFYEDEEEIEEKHDTKPKYVMDEDHQLLLRCAKPLLQSRNASVVMAVAQMFYHIAPRSELVYVAKPLIRLLRGHREVQAVVLQNIATMTLKKKGIFEPFLKSFYVRSTDPTHVRILKLEALTNLASETNISTILREFQTYVRSSDKQFVAHTIQAIGRCATNIAEVTDTCLSGLVGLLSNRDESVVAESIVVIKKLLQMNPSQHSEIINHMSKLFDNIQVGMARASILWLIGEYSEYVPKIAPDVLRRVAKNFTSEEDIVKLQAINLAAKLFVTNYKQTKLLTQYVLQLAKYDQNYDIRDRARFIRHLILPSSENGGVLQKHAKKILLSPKPAPVLESPFKNRDQFQLGSLSHSINSEANGYQKLPDFPETKPDTSVRNVEVPTWTKKSRPGQTKKPAKVKSFYSDKSSESESGSATEDSESDSGSGSESGSASSDEESTEGPDSRVSDSDALSQPPRTKEPSSDEQSDSGSSDSYSESSSGTDSDASSSPPPSPSPTKKKATKNVVNKTKEKKPVSLLDLDDFGGSQVTNSVSSTTPAQILSPLTADLQGLSLDNTSNNTSGMDYSFNSHTPQKYELLHRMTGEGLSASYRYTRRPCIYSNKMVSIELMVTNHGDAPINNIRMGNKKLQGGLQVHDFDQIDVLAPGASLSSTMGVDFCDTTQPLIFDLCTETRKFNVQIKIPVGELVKPTTMHETEYIKQQGKLGGMNENTGKLNLPSSLDDKEICKRITHVLNVCRVPSTQDNIYRFAGKTASCESVLLVCFDQSSGDSTSKLQVHCDKMVIGSMIFKQIKEKLSEQ
ncbi:AP-3 complex subunit beta-1-like [Styela clava]